MKPLLRSILVASLGLDAGTGTSVAQPPSPKPEAVGRASSLPESFRLAYDVNYAGGGNPRQTLDLYAPVRNPDAPPLPVVVAIHGGAFRMGHKGHALGDVAALVLAGDYAVATINYRLSGEAIWPAQVHDCKAAIRWIRANAAKYHLDPDRIGVIGGSAGGHLAAMLGTSGGVSDLEGVVGDHVNVGSGVRCVVDEFGPTDFLAMDDYPGKMKHNPAGSPESQLIGGPIQENKEKTRAASPITYVTHDDPPFLILHGTEDPLVPFNQSERLAAALRKAGVPTLFVPVAGAGHGGFRSPEVPKRIRQFFDKHLRGQDVGPISDESISDRGSRPGPR